MSKESWRGNIIIQLIGKVLVGIASMHGENLLQVGAHKPGYIYRISSHWSRSVKILQFCIKNGSETLMREVVEEAVTKRARVVATGEWETAIRGIPNPVESLATYSSVSALPLEEKMFIRMRERQVAGG